MASFELYHASAVAQIFRHNARETIHNSNQDIDPAKTQQNEKMIHHDRSDYEAFKERLQEIPHRKRKDLNVMGEVIITTPRDLPAPQKKMFFEKSLEFVKQKFGSENVIQATIHRDEMGAAVYGTEHVHIDFIPVSQITGRVNAHDVITRSMLQQFHPELQRYLRAHGINCTVHSGITREQGGARSVKELKRASQERARENPFSKERRYYERSGAHEYTRDIKR